MQAKQQQSVDNMIRINQSSQDIVQPLDLDRFEDSKSMPRF